MKKVILISFLVIVFTSLIYGIKINEIELNPLGVDIGNKWFELDNKEEIK